MIITKNIDVKWNPNRKKYYESKGYIFTKMYEIFNVKIEDVSKESHEKIESICDCCGNNLPKMSIKEYHRWTREDGNRYCKKCGNQNGKLKTFYDWCVENDRQDILERWDYELNVCSPKDITYSSNKKYYLRCPFKKHPSEAKNINSFTNNYHEGTIDCKACNSFAQWGIDNICEDFLEKYWDYEKNNELGIDPWKISHGSFSNKVWIKCQEKDYHESYVINPYVFITGVRCGYCHSLKVHYLDSLGYLYPKVLEIWSDKNKKTPYDYTSFSRQNVYWKCPCGKHKDYRRNVDTSNCCGFRCPECSRERDESFLQEKVRLYLESNNYIILHENSCTIVPKNPKTKMPLPFDNEVKELKLIIEVHGEQHYKVPSGKWFGESFDLHKRQVYDRYKRIFAKSKGYNYLEIPYYTDDKKETWKKLIDYKIKEILNDY